MANLRLSRVPSLLGALMAMALGGLGLPENLRDAERSAETHPHGRRRHEWGSGNKRYHRVDRAGKRVPVPAGSRRPACKFIPNVAGLRYEHGAYVRRNRVNP